MKITKTYLRKMIKEELSAVMEGIVVPFAPRLAQKEKEREDTQAASLQRRIKDHQNLLKQFLKVKEGATVLDRLAKNPKGDPEEDTEGHKVLQDLGYNKQLEWKLLNVIEAWKERRKKLVELVSDRMNEVGWSDRPEEDFDAAKSELTSDGVATKNELDVITFAEIETYAEKNR